MRKKRKHTHGGLNPNLLLFSTTCLSAVYFQNVSNASVVSNSIPLIFNVLLRGSYSPPVLLSFSCPSSSSSSSTFFSGLRFFSFRFWERVSQCRFRDDGSVVSGVVGVHEGGSTVIVVMEVGARSFRFRTIGLVVVVHLLDV